MGERRLRQWRLHRTREPVAEAVIYGALIGVGLRAGI
jgi:hypothetical protein